MDTELNTLFSFLDRFEPEVSGRSASDLGEHLREKLTRLASGNLTDAERSEVVPALLEREEARLFLISALVPN
jgi:hypothetical protein